MKNIYLFAILSGGLFLGACGPSQYATQPAPQPAPQPAYYDPGPSEDISYQSFYDQLSPYGNWISYPGYGYVWRPNAGPDFRPYFTNGNWMYTNAGWTWASDYNWGWAPFHYGRWFYENGYGWMWVPGNEWAPAWVSWRGGGDYYGWAPLGPRVSVDMAMSNYNPPAYYWNFVPNRYIGSPHWHNYYVNGARNVTIINNTTIINNYSGTDRHRWAYAPGPDPNEVRRVSGNNISTVQIRSANQPGARYSGNQYAIYQPRVSGTTATRGNDAGRPAAPVRYENFNNVRPSEQNPAYSNPPANNAPVNTRPANNPPVNPRPAAAAPVNNAPVNNGPVNNAPVNNAPVNNVPVNNTPVNPRPVAPAPANNNPVNNVPVNNSPVNPRPAAPAPGNSTPAGNVPANTPANNARQGTGNTPYQDHLDRYKNQPSGNPQGARPTGQPAQRQPAQQTPQSARPDNTRPAPAPAPVGNTVPVQNPSPREQTGGRPAGTGNTGTAQPVQRALPNEEKSKEQPHPVKTREAE